MYLRDTDESKGTLIIDARNTGLSGLTPLGQVTIQTDTSGWPGDSGPVVALARPAGALK